VGLSVPRAVWLIIAVQSVVVALAVGETLGRRVFAISTLPALLFVVAFVAIATLRWLGYREFIALGRSIRSVLSKALSVVRYKIWLTDMAIAIERAESPVALQRLLLSLVDGQHVIGLELNAQQGTADAIVLGIQPLDASLACHAQRFVSTGIDGQPLALTLRCWSSRPGLRHHRGDHILAILGPALQRWLVAQATQVRRPVWTLDGLSA
jgi:hypothetical protein